MTVGAVGSALDIERDRRELARRGHDAANTDNAGPSSTSCAPPTTATTVMPSITCGVEQVRQRERQIVHRARRSAARRSSTRDRDRRRRTARASRRRPHRPRARRRGVPRARPRIGEWATSVVPPELDPQADESDHRTEHASGDRRARRTPLLDRHRHLGDPEPGAVGAEHQFGVEQVRAVATPAGDRLDRRRDASPSSRACRTPASPKPTRSTDEKPAVMSPAGPRARRRSCPARASSRPRWRARRAPSRAGRTRSTKPGS